MKDRKLKKCKYENSRGKCCLDAVFGGKWVKCKGHKCVAFNPILYEGKY